MSLFRAFPKSKFITPLRKPTKPNQPNKREITIINPITMEKINNNYSNESSSEFNENLRHGERKDSPFDSGPEDFNEGREREIQEM